MKRALTLALAAAALIAPAAAQARTDDFAKPVLFVPGPDTPACSQFDAMKAAFGKFSTTVKGNKVELNGKLITLGLTASAQGCDRSIAAPSGAGIAGLGDELAAWITKNYDKQPVDVVAAGQGGLILRSAIATHPTLQVEDAVTIATPHAGSTLHRNPQGAGGTDWSVIGSDKDTVVPGQSATDMDAAHKTIYSTLTHEQLLTDASTQRDTPISYAHDGGAFKQSTTAPHPLQRVGEDLVFGGDGAAGVTCALAATEPGECGVTPIVLLPGFAASELVCSQGSAAVDMWPGAIKVGTKFETMALDTDGVRPEPRNDSCASTIRPTGNAVQSVLGNSVHESSSAWIKRMGGQHGYVFGWDWRRGPDFTLPRLDQYIDWVRNQHGASKVAIVAHSYGGILARWYIDDPARAKKVARVANFGSPFWGAPKAWFAIAYGYETPKDENSDKIVYNGFFKHWTKNLTGMYYLLPPQAWFNGMPGALSPWLEINERPVGNAGAAATWIGSDSAADGNEALARDVFAKHRAYVDGFKTYNGSVDWRIFVGSGLASMGHVRAYTSKDIDPQYSWFNGDSTVPLVSQRQSATATGKQLGDQVKTYNFCNIKHMDEMETQPIQDAVTPFIVSGADPIVDEKVLRSKPCPLAASEYRVTGEEDNRSQWLTAESEVRASAASGAHAAQAPSGRMTLEQASAAGLIQLAKTPNGLDFVTTTDKQLTYEGSGSGTVTVTPLTGDAQTARGRVYELSSKPISIVSKGAASESSAPSRPADRKAPRTTASFKGGKLRAKARDAGGVAATFVQVGKRAPKIYKRALRVGRKGTIRVWSVDRAGNTERKRTVKR